MARIAIFVDAGYLFAQGSVALVGQKLPRARVILNVENVVDALTTFSRKVSSVDLLRVYWYDGTSTGATAQHIALAHLPSLKVKLGFVNKTGQQKGVDSLIITDMITLARNRAMSDAVLLSGDEDLRVGVQQAQEFGVRVHLLGIRPSRGSQSLFLLQEADSTHEWGPDDLAPFLSCKLPEVAKEDEPAVEALQPAEPQEVIGRLVKVAEAVAGNVDVGELKTLVAAIEQTGHIPRDSDGRLLARGRAALKVEFLDPAQKRSVRTAFLEACKRRLPADTGATGGSTGRDHPSDRA